MTIIDSHMDSPNLPLEIIGEIARHLPQPDLLRLALTAKAIHDTVIGYFYRNLGISAVNEGSLSLTMQRFSIKCMRALLSDERKRLGVEALVFHGIGMVNIHVQNPEIVIPEPYNTEIKKKRSEWIRKQPTFNMLVGTLLSGMMEFPRLETVCYDANALLTESDTARFLSFVRCHPGIKNVVVCGNNAWTLDRLTFTRIPCDLVCHLARLKCAVIYGPVLPLLLGFSFSSNRPSSEFSGLVRDRRAPDTLPLNRVHFSWPQRLARIVQTDDNNNKKNAIDLDLLDVVKALSSVCKSTLELLSIVMDDDLDEELIDILSTCFPNLRELELRPARLGTMVWLPDHAFLRRTAQKLGRLKHLERFMYCNMDKDSEEAVQTVNVLKTDEHWDETSRYFADHCSAMEFISLYSLKWRRYD